MADESPDLIVVDGSFYGFGIPSRLVRDRRIQQEAFEYGSDVVDHVVDSTSRLLGSGRAVGVVKGVTTAAIDGWIIKATATTRTYYVQMTDAYSRLGWRSARSSPTREHLGKLRRSRINPGARAGEARGKKSSALRVGRGDWTT